MYIIAIAWLYVILMMAITAKTFFAGAMNFFWYGLLPCALFLWLVGTPQRKRNRLRRAAQQRLSEPDRPDTQSD